MGGGENYREVIVVQAISKSGKTIIFLLMNKVIILEVGTWILQKNKDWNGL